LQPHHDGLKVRYRSTVDSSPLAPVAGYAVFALRGRRVGQSSSRALIWQRRRDLHPLDIRFERPTARLLGARRHKVAPRLGLAPRSFRLTGERITLILPRNKIWSGISVLPRVSLRPKRSGFLSSSCPMADSGGLSPQTPYEGVPSVFKTGTACGSIHYP
jgi:hypothetical protein